MRSDAHEPREGSGSGRLAPTHGTPVPVDVSSDRRVRDDWVAFLAGPVLWMGHFMLVYLVAEAGCTGGGEGLHLLGPPVPILTTLVATGVVAVLCALAALWAFRRWRTGRAQPHGTEDTSSNVNGDSNGERPRDPLMYAGFLLSAFSLVAVLFTGASALVLGPC